MLLRENLDDRHVPVGLMATRFKPSSHHVLFATVRNPITFFRSYYHHVLGHGEYHNHGHYDYKASTKGFGYLMESIMNRDDKWPSRKFLFPQLFDQSGRLVVDWINRNESLDEDMSMFANSLGYKFLAQAPKRAAPVKELMHYYSDSLMDEVLQTYRREFELFGYSDNSAKKVVSSILLHRDVSQINMSYDYLSDSIKVQ
tara:strand:- start:988 stop:1587 length:600 start_codon:yes stop_codon:yes gene_type:complete